MPIVMTGPPPFDLPSPQFAKAEAADTNVRLTFRVVDEHGQPIDVRILLDPIDARGLASQIHPAARQAEVTANYRR